MIAYKRCRCEVKCERKSLGRAVKGVGTAKSKFGKGMSMLANCQGLNQN